jgi:hypothetical protein
MSNEIGTLSVDASFDLSKSGGLKQKLAFSVTDWGWSNIPPSSTSTSTSGATTTTSLPPAKGNGLDLESFNFKTSVSIPSPVTSGCLSFAALANGKMIVGNNEVTLVGASIQMDCNGLKYVGFDVNFTHTPKWGHGTSTESIGFFYPATKTGGNWSSGTKYFYGSAGFDYTRSFSDKYKGVRFDRNVDVSVTMSIAVDTTNPLNTAFTFDGSFDADRVSGDITGSMDLNGFDFTCSGQLRLNPENAGVYNATWDDL